MEDAAAWWRSQRETRVRNLDDVIDKLRSGRGQPSAEDLSDALLEAMRAGNKEQLKDLVNRVKDGRLREDSLAAAWRRARVQRLPLSKGMQLCTVAIMVLLRYGRTTEELSGKLLRALRANSLESVEALLRTVTNVRLQKDSLMAAWRRARDQGVFLSDDMRKLRADRLIGYMVLLRRELTLGWDALWGLVDRLLDEYLPRLLELLGRDGEEDDEAVELATLSALAIRELKVHFHFSTWEKVEYLLVTFVEARTVYKTLTFLVAKADRLKEHLEFFLEKVRGLKNTYSSLQDRKKALKEMKKAPNVIDQRLTDILEDFTLLRDWHSLAEAVEALEAAIAALRLPSQSWEEWGWLALRRGLFLAGEKMKNTWSSPNLSVRYAKLLELTAPEDILKLLSRGIRDVQEHPRVPGSNAEALTMSDLDSEQQRKWLEEELGRVLHTVSYVLAEAESDLLAKKGKNLDIAQIGRVKTSLRSNCVASDTNVVYREVKKILEAANREKKDGELEKIIKELGEGDLLRHKNAIHAGFLNTALELVHLTDHNHTIYQAVLKHCPQHINRIRQLLDWKSAEGLSNFQADLNESSCIGGGSGEASRCAIERVLSALEAIPSDSNHEGPVKYYAIEGGLQALASRWYEDDRAPPLLVPHGPALFGRQLRNCLSHKDLAMTLFFPTVVECSTLWTLLDRPRRSLAADRPGVTHRVQEPAAAAAVNAEVLRLARLKDKMFRGARRGDLAEVQRAAGLGVDLSSRDCRGRTLLHAAAEAGQASLVDWLLKTKAVDPLARDWQGRSALHCAGTAEVAKLLLAEGHEVAPCIYGRSPLHSAALAGRDDVILELIPHYDLNAKDGGLLTPLHLAAHGGHEAAVRVLLQAGARYESAGERVSPLTAAAEAGSAPVVSLLLDPPPPLLPQPSDDGCWTAASLAGLHRHVDVFSVLTAELKRRGAQLDSAAAQRCVGGVAVGGSTEVAYELLEHWPEAAWLKLDIYDQTTALSIAATLGHADLVGTLLNGGADPLQRDKDSYTALHWAAGGGSVEVIDALWGHTQAEQDEQRREALGRLWEGRGEELPPLYVAAGRGHLAAVKLLVKRGADKDAAPPDDPDRTPLRQAANRGHAEVVEWLVKEGARLFDRRKPCRTPLMVAARRGRLPVVKLLMPASQPTDTEQQQRERLDLLQHVSPEGCTALHGAVVSGSLGVVKYLLERELQLLELHYSRCVAPRNVTVYSGEDSALKWCVLFDAPSSVFRELLRYMEDPRLMELAGKDVTDVRDMVRAALNCVDCASLVWTVWYGRGNNVQEMKKVLRESLRRLLDPVLSQAEESLRLLSLQ